MSIKVSVNPGFFKHLTPYYCFGVAILFASFVDGTPDSEGLLWGSLVFAAFGLYLDISKQNTLDEVYDCGHYLKVKNKGITFFIHFNEIKHAKYDKYNYQGSVHMVVLELKNKSRFGKKLKFITGGNSQLVSLFDTRFLDFGKADINDLVDRINNTKKVSPLMRRSLNAKASS